MGGGSSKTKPAQTSTVSSQPPPPPPAAPATTPPPPEPKYGTYTPFTDFPTPELLSKAQLDYKEANVEYKLDENGIPLPFPPRTTKSQVFNQKDYEDIDEHARKTPTEKGAGTYKDLAAHLVSPAKNDIGKVRAFFVWIASQGLQRVIAYRNSYGFPPKESPLYLLTNILVQRKSGNYSDLLQKLCSAENIPCKNIWSDFVKDVHYTVGDTKIAYGNFYCIVYVDGNWRIINQHWGSQGVIVNTNRDWELLAGRQNNRTNEDDFTVVYKCDDRYFLPDPVEYIYRTFATDPNDQLLARPITKQEFLEVAYLYPRYFEMGFTSISHPKCSISTDSGKIILQFGLPIDSQCKFDYAFFKSKLLPKYNSIEGIPLERYILAEIKANQLQITINFRNYGKHKIELYGSSGGKDGMVEVCEYLLFSERPVYCEPYPQKRNGMTIWGMALESKFLGLEAHADIGGIVYAKAGRAEIRIKKTKTNTVVLYTEMWSEELTWTELKHYVRYYETKTEIVIWIDLPKHGQYVLRMQGRDKTDNEQTHTIGNFLIKADRGYKDLQKYPIEGADQSRIGSMVENIFVTPETHPNPFINWGEESELVIGMNITQEAVFTAELKLSSNRLVKKQMSNCLFLERTRDKLTVYTRFQQIGMYEINIRANASIVYQYVVKVEKVGKEALPYPSFKLPSLREQFKLLEPRSLYLKCDEKVHFKMMIPNATSVNLSHNNTSQTLTNIQGTDLWEGDIKTGVDEGDLNLVVTSKKNSPELYLCYKVIGRSETWNEINDQISESTKEAEEHDRSVQKNDEEEEKLAKQREDELKEKQRKERENFDRNKTKYTKMEKDMEEEEKNEAKETEEFSPDKVDENQTEEDLTKQTEKEVQKAQERMPTWQRDYERMKPVLALQKLRQAAIAKDPKELRSAIDECKDLNGIDPDEIRRAEELLVRILWKQELNKACDSRDCKQIETVINRIIEAGDEKLLASDIQEARDKMLSIKRREKLRAKSLQLNAATMAEIRSYKEPIPIVHKILQAVLLLFDQGEFITEEWKYCQSQCKSQGRQNILRKIVNVDVTKLNPEIVARVREIINSIAYEEVKERSASAGVLCAWATMVVENADVGDDVTPADVERQKELFENQLYMKSSSDSSNVMKDIV